MQASFNAGEFAPELEGRVDIGKYSNAVKLMENFIPLVQGPARRRGGTKYVAEIKDSADRTWLARFEFNTTQAYVLEFGDAYVRFFTDNGVLLQGSPAAYSGGTAYVVGDMVSSGGTNYYCIAATTGNAPTNATYWYPLPAGGQYEIPSPWAVADLTRADGSFALEMVQSGDVLYICHPDYAPRKLSRLGATTWTIEEFQPVGGPFNDTDPDETTTVFASAATGTGITLVASAGLFAATDVGSLFLLERNMTTDPIKQWEAGKSFSLGDKCRVDYRVYECVDAGTTGSVTPTHTEGTAWDGAGGGKCQWKFLDAGFGWAEITAVATPSNKTITNAVNNGAGLIRITATAHGFSTGYRVTVAGVGGVTAANGTWTITVIDANTFDLDGSTFAGVYTSGGTAAIVAGTVATADVLSRIPLGAVTSSYPTNRWAFGSWNVDDGYPSHVAFFRGRLAFARALDRKLWFSVAASFEDFTDRDRNGEVVADQAVTLTVESDQSNPIQYLAPTSDLIVGTAGGEYICREMTDSDPFGPANATIVRAGDYGSRGVQPINVGNSVLFVQRSGRKVREVVFDALQDGYKSQDTTILAPHVAGKGQHFVQLAYQREPHSIIWAARSDGALRGFTFNKEQYSEPPFGGWHRHTIGGSGVVESLVCVPSPNDDRDDLWMIVRRTINGGTKRYVEYMQAEWESGDAQEDAFYVDCGLTYDGAAATTISGLDHLEGATVDVLADGASHPQRTVASGAITLARSASVVQVGLPCPCKLQTLRINAGATDGTAQGKTKRINRMVVRLLDTLGGKMGPAEDQLDEILFRSTGDNMDAPPPIFTGDKEMPWRGGYEKEGYVWYVNEQPFPATIVAIMPQVTTQDR